MRKAGLLNSFGAIAAARILLLSAQPLSARNTEVLLAQRRSQASVLCSCTPSTGLSQPSEAVQRTGDTEPGLVRSRHLARRAAPFRVVRELRHPAQVGDRVLAVSCASCRHRAGCCYIAPRWDICGEGVWLHGLAYAVQRQEYHHDLLWGDGDAGANSSELDHCTHH